MITVTVTLSDYHKSPDREGYTFMFGYDKVYLSSNKFSFEIEALDDYCSSIGDKLKGLDLEDFEIKFKK